MALPSDRLISMFSEACLVASAVCSCLTSAVSRQIQGNFQGNRVYKLMKFSSCVTLYY